MYPYNGADEHQSILLRSRLNFNKGGFELVKICLNRYIKGESLTQSN